MPGKCYPIAVLGCPSVGGQRTVSSPSRCTSSFISSAPAGAVPASGLSSKAARSVVGLGRPSFGGRRTNALAGQGGAFQLRAPGSVAVFFAIRRCPRRFLISSTDRFRFALPVVRPNLALKRTHNGGPHRYAPATPAAPFVGRLVLR